MYGDHNMGLPLGPQSGLVAVDIDTDDEKVIAAILAVLPKSPWQRVGKKGMVLIYRWIDNATARIRDENEKSRSSRFCRAARRSSSHHRSTPRLGKPYWSNVDLIGCSAGRAGAAPGQPTS